MLVVYKLGQYLPKILIAYRDNSLIGFIILLDFRTLLIVMNCEVRIWIIDVNIHFNLQRFEI